VSTATVFCLYESGNFCFHKNINNVPLCSTAAGKHESAPLRMLRLWTHPRCRNFNAV